ncbi:MAG TPA: DUF4349 domain-containing protein [Sphingobacteriaceae bacterium]
MKLFRTFTFIIISACILACNNNHSGEVMNTASDTVSVTAVTGEGVKLIKTASINFQVKDVFESAKQISNTVRKFGGMISDRQIESVDEDSRRLEISDDSVRVISSYMIKASMLVRVPTAQLDPFIEQVSNSAVYIQNSRLQIEDKSLQYMAAEMKKQNYTATLKQQAGKDHRPDQSIDLATHQDKLIEEQINNRQINADVQYSTVALNFYQNPLVRTETAVNSNLSDYQLPFARSMRNAFFNGWDYFLAFIIGLANLWMFILAGALLLYSYRYYKSKRSALNAPPKTGI